MPNFRLRFDENDIEYWADRYEFGTDDIPNKVGTYARNNYFLDSKRLYQICLWKSKRRANLAKKNNDASVKEITRFSFNTNDEYSRIESLTLLKGVQYPTASVILHFCVNENYPILDMRAIWSLSEDKPSHYNFDYWWEYVSTCRKISHRNKISIRYLDKALWQYSSENQ